MSFNDSVYVCCGCNLQKKRSGWVDNGRPRYWVDKHESNTGHGDGLLSYRITEEAPLEGVPLREANFQWLDPFTGSQANCLEVHCCLFINGLTITPVPDGDEITIVLSPFSSVRTCRFQSGAYNGLRVFKIVSHTGICYFLGTEEQESQDDERLRWACEVSHVIRLVTQSLFPIFEIVCDPVQGVASTARRILAGYLLHKDDANSISLPYVELHAFKDGYSSIALYDDENAESPMMYIGIDTCTVCTAVPALNGTSFRIGEHFFAARTFAERRLWLRAICNIKLKLQYMARNPNAEDIENIRAAVYEKVCENRIAMDGIVVCAALLPRSIKPQRHVPDSEDFFDSFFSGDIPDVADELTSNSSTNPRPLPAGAATEVVESPEEPTKKLAHTCFSPDERVRLVESWMTAWHEEQGAATCSQTYDDLFDIIQADIQSTR